MTEKEGNIGMTKETYTQLYYGEGVCTNLSDTEEIKEFGTKEECINFLKKKSDLVVEALPKELESMPMMIISCTRAAYLDIKPRHHAGTPISDYPYKKYINVFFEKEKMLIEATSSYGEGYFISKYSPCSVVKKKTTKIIEEIWYSSVD